MDTNPILFLPFWNVKLPYHASYRNPHLFLAIITRSMARLARGNTHRDITPKSGDEVGCTVKD
jgi:hypothetical protein